MVALEQLRVELRLGLDGIAAVDEHRGALGEHDQHARGTGEAGQPRQALRAGGQVLVAMLVGERQDQAVEPPRAQLGAQPAQPFRMGGSRAGSASSSFTRRRQARSSRARLAPQDPARHRAPGRRGRDHAAEQPISLD